MTSDSFVFYFLMARYQGKLDVLFYASSSIWSALKEFYFILMYDPVGLLFDILKLNFGFIIG